ncbi:MAG: hypothetical protein DMF64_04245 [Acidobacteria bacterium]|nr:MAG: hypothetical protein DMF64_04245 [Acidobacteriota bacterium]
MEFMPNTQQTEIKSMRNPQPHVLRAHASCLVTIIAATFLLCACNGTREQTETAPAPAPTPSQSAPANSPTPTMPTPVQATTPMPAPPQATEVANKVAQIFKGAVELDAPQQDNVLVGDFNGDGSQDIAIIVRATPAKLDEMNSEVSNWILDEPQKITPPDPSKAAQSPPAPAKVKPGDLLLAVIHGFKESGWHNPDAQQTYLLEDAIGRGLRVEARQAAQSAVKLNTLRLRGDVIEQDLNGAHGFLYWTGARYGWFAQAKH